MQTLLKLLLFFTLLTLGISLECETCSSTTGNCSGPMAVCDEKSETCLVSYTVIKSPGKMEEKTEKGCSTPYNGTFPPIFFNVARRVYSSQWLCCMGKACKTAFAPPFSSQCESCNVYDTTCVPRNERCTPEVDGCYTLLLETTQKTLYLSKGCIMKATCEKLKGEVGKVITREYGNFPVGAIIQSVKCSKAPVSSASLLLTLSGLLLKKFFF